MWWHTRRNGRVYLNRRGCQFGRLLTAEVCASAVVMVDTSRSEVVWRVLATHSIRQFPRHFPSRASLCDITFHLDSTFIYSLGAEHCPLVASQLKDMRDKYTKILQTKWGPIKLLRTKLNMMKIRRISCRAVHTLHLGYKIQLVNYVKDNVRR